MIKYFHQKSEITRMKWIMFRRQVLGRSLSGPVHTNEIVNINDETELAKWRANKYFRVVILSRTETWNEVVGQIQSIFIILYHAASVSLIFCRSISVSVVHGVPYTSHFTHIGLIWVVLTQSYKAPPIIWDCQSSRNDHFRNDVHCNLILFRCLNWQK